MHGNNVSIMAETRRRARHACVSVSDDLLPLHGIPIASMTEGQTAQQKHGRHFHLWRLEVI